MSAVAVLDSERIKLSTTRSVLWTSAAIAVLTIVPRGFDAEALLAAIQRSIDTYHDAKTWSEVQRNGIAEQELVNEQIQKFGEEVVSACAEASGGLAWNTRRAMK